MIKSGGAIVLTQWSTGRAGTRLPDREHLHGAPVTPNAGPHSASFLFSFLLMLLPAHIKIETNRLTIRLVE